MYGPAPGHINIQFIIIVIIVSLKAHRYFFTVFLFSYLKEINKFVKV